VLGPRLAAVGLTLSTFVLAFAPTALGGEERAASPAAPATPPPVFSNSRVIVEWAAGADHADKAGARGDAEVAFESDLGNRDFQLVEVEAGQAAEDAISALRADPAVAVAERDGYSALDSIPNDPAFGQLWGLRNTGAGIDGAIGALPGADVNAPLAWDRAVGSPGTVIADIDSGYRFGDSELGAVAWSNPGETPANSADDDGNGLVDDVHGYDFVGPSADSPSNDADPSDDNLISGGHGIHTAGTMGAAGDNGIGITGVARNVRIMALRVCANSAAAGNEARCPTSSQVAAINYAGAEGARAANMSLGGTSFSEAVRNAIAANPGTLYVISAGNDAQDNDSVPHYPCDYDPLAEAKSAVDNVLCVAATNQADELAGFSDWGATSVDLGAPGTEILSTFPAIEKSLHEDFEASDFASRWSKSGTDNFGRGGAGDGPLTSSGMTDSPGSAPAPVTQYDTTLTTGVAIPAGSGACTLRGMRYRDGGSGGTFYYQVLSDGSPVFTNSTSTPTPGSSMAPFNTVPILGLGGHSVKLRFGFTSGPTPTSANGIWLDELKLECYEPTSAPLAYAFLQGTSMAAPHVTGAAGLLFSLEPAATVEEVRDALLAGVDSVPSLSGITATGGRLDVAKAMDSLEGDPVDTTAPAKPVLPDPVPGSGSNDNHPRIKGTAEAGSTVVVFRGTACNGSVAATGTAGQLAGAGIEVTVPDNSITFFSARAIDAGRNESACSSPTTYLEDSPEEFGVIREEQVTPATIPVTPAVQIPSGFEVQRIRGVCTVPKLAGLTLGKATAALSHADCTLGSVVRPKAKKGHKLGPLVVKSSAPAAGAKTTGKVNLTLGSKPKPRKHHH
jgi:subtilisin family serine protease